MSVYEGEREGGVEDFTLCLGSEPHVSQVPSSRAWQDHLGFLGGELACGAYLGSPIDVVPPLPAATPRAQGERRSVVQQRKPQIRHQAQIYSVARGETLEESPMS